MMAAENGQTNTVGKKKVLDFLFVQLLIGKYATVKTSISLELCMLTSLSSQKYKHDYQPQ